MKKEEVISKYGKYTTEIKGMLEEAESKSDTRCGELVGHYETPLAGFLRSRAP